MYKEKMKKYYFILIYCLFISYSYSIEKQIIGNGNLNYLKVEINSITEILKLYDTKELQSIY